MKRIKKIFSVFLALFLAVSLCACAVNTGGDPITARWKVVSSTLNNTTTSFTGFWGVWDKVSGTKIPEFDSDGNTFTFSMSGKDHTGTVVKNGDIYELYWDNASGPNKVRMSTATINGDILTIQMTDDLTMIFKMK
ncbi:MAG: hypothetical protein J5625_03195 [Lachnospiraceae bacterium]|nr:hypothetical protein [Lachnospiraceae bacterium]